METHFIKQSGNIIIAMPSTLLNEAIAEEIVSNIKPEDFDAKFEKLVVGKVILPDEHS